jgi:DivIVA domain-containing protein
MRPHADGAPGGLTGGLPAEPGEVAFARVMRGYDQAQVDEYVAAVTAELRRLRERVRVLEEELGIPEGDGLR